MMLTILNNIKRDEEICSSIFLALQLVGKQSYSIRMVRLSIAFVVVLAVIYVLADEDEDNSCTEAKDCPCGSVCNAGTCAQGCMLYDTFMAAGSEAEVYGRNCRCGDAADERGMLLECEEGVAFTRAPKGVPEWQNNPSCEEPAPATVAPAADVAADAPAA